MKKVEPNVTIEMDRASAGSTTGCARRSSRRQPGRRSGVRDLLLLLPDLTVLLLRLLRDERVPVGGKAIAVLGVGYVLSPIDVLPSFLFGPIGLIDDLFIVAAALARVLHYVHPDVVRSHWSGQGDALDAIQRATEWSEIAACARCSRACCRACCAARAGISPLRGSTRPGRGPERVVGGDALEQDADAPPGSAAGGRRGRPSRARWRRSRRARRRSGSRTPCRSDTPRTHSIQAVMSSWSSKRALRR